MSHATINDVDLYYELHGNAGAPLVFVHGYTGDISDWRFQVAEFAATHRVLVLDNRGHGQSQCPADAAAYSIDAMASDVERLSELAGFETYHLIGHSMGGAIAQEIALRSPHKIMSLTLHDTSYRFNHRPLEMPNRPPSLPPERLAQVADRFARLPPETLLGCWNALQTWGGSEERAAQIRLPTLVVCGENDTSMIVDGSRRLAELIAGSDLRMIPAAAHSPQEEQPAVYNRVLREFLECAGRN